MIAKYLEGQDEVRLYKDDGRYWPISKDAISDDEELIQSFIEFIASPEHRSQDAK